jgi:glycosyltransferase involved in cell wall biosynthesis
VSGRYEVVHVVPAAFDRARGIVGGAERYAFELARHMAERVPTALVTFGDREERLREGALDVAILKGRAVRGQRTNPWSPALFGWVRRTRVVHCHQRHVLASSTAALAARLLGRRAFVSDLGGGGWDVSGYVDTTRWFHGHLHISEYSRRVSGHAGRPFAHVILGGVDHARFSPDPSVARDGSVLFVGRLLPHKGVNDLVEAMRGRARLVLAGTPYDPRFAADLRALAAGYEVEFAEGMDDGALVNAYRRAAVLVLPSVYRTVYGQETKVPELLGQTLLEAMACETPVVCTDVASMPEVVVHGETGFIVPPNDPAALRERILWLLEHPEEARRMGRAGRRRVLARFDWGRVAEHCLRIYSGAA